MSILPSTFPSSLALASLPIAARFDFPLSSENGATACKAQRITETLHLGDDLKGIDGEDSDLGAPIYAVADGRVLLAPRWRPGLGQRRSTAASKSRPSGREAAVILRICISKWANSRRCSLAQVIARTRGWLDPTAFIEAHRGGPEDQVGRIEAR